MTSSFHLDEDTKISLKWITSIGAFILTSAITVTIYVLNLKADTLVLKTKVEVYEQEFKSIHEDIKSINNKLDYLAKYRR